MTSADQTHEERALPRRRFLSLRVVLWLTVPPLLLAAYLVTAATIDYRAARQYDDWWSQATSLRKFAWYRAQDLVKRPQAFLLRQGMSPEVEGLETLQLRVDPADWERLHADVPGRWDKWTDAELMVAGKAEDVEIKVRGDNSIHWLAEKKSLTVKTEKGHHYKGYRRLGLSLKTALIQYLPHLVAPDFDVLVPRAEVFPVFVNSEFYGIFRMVETPDESFLRHRGLLPGNIYRADMGVRGEYFKNLPREVFQIPFAWDRTAENVRPTAPGDAGLYSFIQSLSGTGFEEHLEFAAHFDGEELSRLLAVMLLFGDPYHMDGVHNQLWYEDPTSGVLHPILWDLRMFNVNHAREARDLNRFLRKLVRDPRIYDGALRALSDWIADPDLRARAVERLHAVYDAYPDHFRHEHLRVGRIRAVGRADQIVPFFDLNIEALGDRIGLTEVLFQAATEGNTTVLDFLVGGHMGCDLRSLATGLPTSQGTEVFCDTDLDGVLGPGDRRVDVRAVGGRLDLVAAEPLLAGCRAVGIAFTPEPLHYRLFMVAPPGLAPGAVTPQLTSRGTGDAVVAGAWDSGAVPEIHGFHPWQFERSTPRPVHLSGEVHLTADLLLEEGAELVLEPGTHLILDPDVSIEARGRVTARGTAERPITVEAAEPGSPWGTFALQGSGADESEFTHVRFSGGGGELIGRIEYKGMVCVYNSTSVEFSECTFADNLRCDDLLNAVRAGVDVRSCTFTGALADAIDFDVTTGEIEACTIEGSGNDGIDLMTCSPRILATLISGSGDKGISIGEDSNPWIFDTLIRDCERGIEVKDRSSPLLIDSTIQGCRTGVLQGRKNWRYAASGRARLVGCVVADNHLDYEGTGGATLTLLETLIGDPGPANAPAWVRAAHGFGAPARADDSPRPPRPAARVTPQEVRYELTFRPEFGAPSAGWRSEHGFERVDAHEDDLVGRLRQRDARISRSVDWDLAEPRSEFLLVIEAAGDDLEDAHLTLESTSGKVEVPLLIDADKDTFRYTTRLLPPGHYTRLVLTATPQTKDGGKLKSAKVRLHGLTVLRSDAAPEEGR